MIFFDISDTSIEAIRLSTSFIFGETISAFNRVEFNGGPVRAGEVQDEAALKKIISDFLENAKPKAIKDKECAFTLPDKRVYTRRFKLSQKKDGQPIFNLLKGQLEPLIPQPLEELAYDYKTLVDEQKGKSEVCFAAIPRTILEGYMKVFNSLDLKPKIAVSESVAAHKFISPLIIGEGTVLYLDVGEEIAIATLMDRNGVVEAFSEPVQTSDLFNGVKKLVKFARERLEKEVNRIILGGGGGLQIKKTAAQEELGLNVVSAEEAVKQFKLKIRVNFRNLSPVTFANVLGLSLLSKEESPLNLLRA
jgi:Tfp pilus assembly PilM family ATPase